MTNEQLIADATAQIRELHLRCQAYAGELIYSAHVNDELRAILSRLRTSLSEQHNDPMRDGQEGDHEV